jgi:hypothetical protein
MSVQTRDLAFPATCEISIGIFVWGEERCGSHATVQVWDGHKWRPTCQRHYVSIVNADRRQQAAIPKRDRSW